MITVECLTVGPLLCNCFIAMDEKTKQAACIDPGGDAEYILDTASKLGANITKIILTHGHVDHVMAAMDIKAKTGAQIIMHEGDRELAKDLKKQAFAFDLSEPEKLEIDHYAKDGEVITIGDAKGHFVSTPGHSEGSVVIMFDNDGIAFTGDTLFSGSIGRCDLWNGSHEKMTKSLVKLLEIIPPDTTLYTGHGPYTTMKAEMIRNPFLLELK